MFPAPAGMNRSSQQGLPLGRVFPAPAGMNRSAPSTDVRSVFPAPAGMNRGVRRGTHYRVFPAPAGMNRSDGAAATSAVFPAPAGMNRHTLITGAAAGVPRARGDEPVLCLISHDRGGVPRARGDEPPLKLERDLLQCKAFAVLTRRHLRQGRADTPAVCPLGTRRDVVAMLIGQIAPFRPLSTLGLVEGQHVCVIFAHCAGGPDRLQGKRLAAGKRRGRDNDRNQHKPRKSAHSEEAIELVTGDPTGSSGGILKGD